MKANKEFIKQRLYAAITANYAYRDLAPDDITDTLDFSKEYDIPSVNLVTLIAELEEEYDIEINISDMHRLHTVNDIAQYIESSEVSSDRTELPTASPSKTINELFE